MQGIPISSLEETGSELLKIMEKKAIPTDRGVEFLRQAVNRLLQGDETPSLLAVFLMLINPGAYKPRFGKF